MTEAVWRSILAQCFYENVLQFRDETNPPNPNNCVSTPSQFSGTSMSSGTEAVYTAYYTTSQ